MPAEISNLARLFPPRLGGQREKGKGDTRAISQQVAWPWAL